MGQRSPDEIKSSWVFRFEQERWGTAREAEEFPRLSHEDLENPENYHQRLKDWIRKQGCLKNR